MNIVNYTGTLENYGIKTPDNIYLTGDAELSSGVVKINLKCIATPYDFCRMLTRDHAAEVMLDIGKTEKYIAQYCYSPFWARPTFGCDLSQEKKEMQYLLTKSGDKYTFVFPISNEKFNTTCVSDGNNIKLCVNMLYSGAEEIYGEIAVITEDNDPYKAVKNGIKTAFSNGLIKTPPKEEKSYPDVLNKLGWCSWNAFYHDVTEEKLFLKLEEFKKKNIPIKWILIDDGWSEFKDMKLTSIYEDRIKFPNGLKHTISRMKEEYGIEAVGVWHSLTGYWYGTNFKDESVMQARKNRLIPRGYDFYSKWHTYLKEQGVDFIKVDSQGNSIEFLKNAEGALDLIADIFDGLEQSAKENFDFMINCMGMNNINSLNHKYSVILRSSDDFFPDKKDGFYYHVLSNIYNSVFCSELFYCDFDMWWSKHFAAKQNAALRFMSGGPVYMSDEIGETDERFIKMFVKPDGAFLRFKNALRPTYDCLFGYENILKAFNEFDGGFVVAAFTFSNSGTVTVSSEDFAEYGEYDVIEFFSGEKHYLSDNEKIQANLHKNDVEIFIFKRHKKQ